MASKTDKNTVKTVPDIPDTLAEFVEQHEELAGCPEFVPAHEFSVAQTCDFELVVECGRVRKLCRVRQEEFQ